MAVHSLEPTPDTVTQFFSPATPAVLTVDPGDALVVRSLDARGHLERPDRRASDAPKMFNPRRGHCLAGNHARRDGRDHERRGRHRQRAGDQVGGG